QPLCLYVCIVLSPPPEFSTLSLHDALPISRRARFALRTFVRAGSLARRAPLRGDPDRSWLASLATIDQPLHLAPGVERRLALERSEEHTSELQSREKILCRLLLEKKKKHTR